MTRFFARVEKSNFLSSPDRVMDPNETLQQAISHHQAGQLPEAEELYLRILQTDPGHPDANHNLGLMALQLERAELGLPYLQAAWEADPSIDQYWLSLTECLLAMNHSEDALLLIEEAIKRGADSPQARQLLARANGSYNKALPPASDVQEVMDLSKSARHAELEQRIRPLIDLYPDWAFGWNTLGIALQQQGKDGVAALRQAVNLAPNDAGIHNNLGMLLKEQGMLDEALSSFRRALQIKPKYVEAHFNLGMALKAKGQAGEAIASLKQALRIKPDAVAHNELGLLLQTDGRLDEAIESLRSATKIAPSLAETHNNLGLALQKQGKLGEAAASFRRALEIRPDYADAHCNLGLILHLQGQYDDALISLGQAIKADPGNASRYLNLGLMQQVQYKLKDAVASFCRALEIDPDLAQALNSMGFVLFTLGHLDAAMISIRRALELKPDYYDAYLVLGAIQNAQGLLVDAAASFRKALEMQPDAAQPHNSLGMVLVEMGQWDDAIPHLRRAVQLAPHEGQYHASLLFTLSHDMRLDARSLFMEHCRFAEQFEAPLRGSWRRHANSRDPERRLQVGFVSGDLYNHAVASFVEPLFASLAAFPQLSLHAYCNNVIEDNVTQRLHCYFKHWHSIAGLSDTALAQKIRADGIDILIDLSGHTAKHRLLTFAHKPAPVQASWIGYPCTTGLQAMDYRIKSKWTEAVGALDDQYVEKLIRLPSSVPFEPFAESPDVNALPALSNGYLTFGSFNRPSKVSDSSLRLWGQVLDAIPGSRLLMGAVNDDLQDRFRARFEALGMLPERLSFHPRTDMKTYLSLHGEVDILLDTFPYGGGTTTSHALWMGVPVLTYAGATPPQRIGLELLGSVGMLDWVARSPEEYVAKAQAAAADLPKLADLRATLRERVANAPHRRPEEVAKDLYTALRMVWRRWCSGLPAESFEVAIENMGIAPQKGNE